MADEKISGLSAITTLAGTEEFVVAASGATKKITAANLETQLGGGLFDAYAVIRDEKTANTAGGTATSGAWRTRDLNTELFDPSGIVTISANQFTLQAGTYYITATAPAYNVNAHKAKLANITDTTDAIIGMSAHGQTTGAVFSVAEVKGRITIAAAKAFEIQHQVQTTLTTNGFGPPSNFAVVEVYTTVEIWREA